MEVDRVHNPFEYEDKIFITMSAEEFRRLRFDMSMAAAHMENLDAIVDFLYDTDDV